MHQQTSILLICTYFTYFCYWFTYCAYSHLFRVRLFIVILISTYLYSFTYLYLSTYLEHEMDVCYRACSFTLLFAQLFYIAKSNSHFIRFIPISFHMFIPISHMFSSDSSMITMFSPYTLTLPFHSHNSHVIQGQYLDLEVYSSYTGGGIYSGGSGYPGTGLISSVNRSLLNILSSSQTSPSSASISSMRTVRT